MTRNLCIVVTTLFLILGSLSVAVARPGLDLVTGGKSDFVIVIPAQASSEEIKAANVLQRYVQMVSGATLAIGVESTGGATNRVFIGATKAGGRLHMDRLPEDAFIIAVKDGNLYLAGQGAKGSLYAVYSFLEKYIGCRKFDAGAPTLPSRQTITLKNDFTDRQEPAFVYREVFFPQSMDTEYLDWHHLDRIYTEWTHSFINQLVPALVYFNAHPEYYALVNGKRYGRQLCLSNDTVLTLATEETKEMINAHPTQEYWSLSPNDDINYCNCDRCKAKNVAEGYIQGSIMPFVNSIASKFPDNQFVTFAYQYAARPPHTLVPAPNVTIFLSNLEVTKEAPLSEASSAANFRKNLSGWVAKTPKVFVWDYIAQFTNFLTPFPVYMNIQPNLQYMKDNGVKGVFEQGTGVTEGDCSPLKSYITAKLLWDPSLSTDDLITDFCLGYYGKAGPYVKSYLYDLQKNCQSSGATLNVYGDSTANMTTYLSPSLVAQYDRELAMASDAVKDNAIYFNRVRAIRLPIQFVLLEQSRLGIDGGRLKPAELSQKVQQFVADCKASGIKSFKEDQTTTPDRYAKLWSARLQGSN